MSWEDDLATHRGGSSSSRPTITIEDADLPQLQQPPTNQPPASAPLQSPFASNRPPAAVAMHDDLPSALSHPAMRPLDPPSADVLRRSQTLSRAASRDRAQLQQSVLDLRKREQDRRQAAHDAEGGHDDEHVGAGAGKENEASLAPSRQARFATAASSKGVASLGVDLGAGGLTDLQAELLAVCSAPSPPRRAQAIQPLDSRLALWARSGETSSHDELDVELREKHKTYLSSRAHVREVNARAREVTSNLHAISVRLAQAESLGDFERLESEYLARRPKTHSSLRPGEAEEEDTPFYDLHSLDLESYASLLHTHQASLASASSVGQGWWRTQLGELEDEPGEARRRQGELERAIEEAEDPFAPSPPRADDAPPPRTEFDRVAPRSASRGVGGGMLLPRMHGAGAGGSQEELELELLRAGHSHSQPRRLTKDQLRAREEGRSYHSTTAGGPVELPAGQRILRSEQRQRADEGGDAAPATTKASSTRGSTGDALRDMEDALDENAPSHVKRPQRKAVSHEPPTQQHRAADEDW